MTKSCPKCGHVYGQPKYPDLTAAGAVIRQLRTDRGLAQKQLAVRMKRSHVAVHLLETGNVKLTIQQLKALASGLEMPLADLVGCIEGAVDGT